MSSQLLIEGVLDVKDPRRSEVRKFWKVWHRQWISFSVIYPGGRREPYLVLSMFRSASETPEKEVKLARDGLRLFRCRSKSRPYRTWAITSGNKMVLYFAAQSEIQAQNWMQAVRDGLWPPCFSFQVVTACTYEVSLIDDDNTFLAGLLGVYGRFVLTADDIISLMHPHWGSTLLEISLDNIKDVHFIREAEVSPAGVFSIILKRVEGSKVKALQFFCNTAEDAIQWILSKLYARRKSLFSDENRIIDGEKSSILNESIPPNPNHQTNVEKDKMTFTAGNQLTFTQVNTNADKTASEYKNPQYLKINTAVCIDQSPRINKDLGNHRVKGNDPETTSKLMLLRQSRTHDSLIDLKNVDDNGFSDFKSDENIYENIINGENFLTTTLLDISDDIDDLNNLVNVSKNYPSERSLQAAKVVSEISLSDTASDSAEYANMSESTIPEDSFNLGRIEELMANDKHTLSDIKANGNIYANIQNGTIISTMKSPDISHDYVDMSNLSNEYSNTKYSGVKASESASVISQIPFSGPISGYGDYAIVNKSNIFKKSHYQILNEQYASNQPTNERISEGNVADIVEISERNSFPNHYITMSKSNDSNCHLCDAVGMINNSTSTDSKMLQQKGQVSTIDSLNDKSFNDRAHLIPNLSSDFLDTSLNFSNFRYKTSGSSSSEEDSENLQWLINEFDSLRNEDSVYEDILDRKGTTYEEIDSSGEECETKLPNAPELPKRPENLEIPDSLRLQKLSKNINQTLQVAEDTQFITKEHPHQNFIKKIKDVNRIMQISPNQEYTKEAFTVELKLPIDAKNLAVLTPSAQKSTKPR